MNQGESQINSLIQSQCLMTGMFVSFARKLQGIKIHSSMLRHGSYPRQTAGKIKPFLVYFYPRGA